MGLKRKIEKNQSKISKHNFELMDKIYELKFMPEEKLQELRKTFKEETKSKNKAKEEEFNFWYNKLSKRNSK